MAYSIALPISLGPVGAQRTIEANPQVTIIKVVLAAIVGYMSENRCLFIGS